MTPGTSVDDRNLDALTAEAARILDESVADFRRWLGAPGVVHKAPGDFATQADLDIEDRVSAALLERTGIPVHGEERGGPDLSTGTSWVLDPIDGTANYSRGLPLTGTLLALVSDGEPIAGMTWLPLLDERWVATRNSLRRNGIPVPPRPAEKLAEVTVAFGQLRANPGQPYATEFRFAALEALSRRTLRVRMFGSTAVDLAWTAGGSCGGALVFGDKPWDNCAGVCQIRAAGGVVTDLDGNPWTLDSSSVLAASPGVHQEIVDLLHDLRRHDS